MLFIIFHGTFGSPEGNWFPDLKEKLEALGQKVFVPEFPVEDYDELNGSGKDYKVTKQTLDNWLKAFKPIERRIRMGEKLCFIGHSLGCVFILHIMEKYRIKLDSAIFVSPFLKRLNKWQFDIVNRGFYKSNFNWNELRKLIPLSYVLYSKNDPYIRFGQFSEFASHMHSSMIPVMRAGHLNSEVNLNEFPLVYELCKSRIDLSMYQRYMEHRRELYSLPYTKGTVEEVVYLDMKEVIDEGVFHFRNLRKGGFCTFYAAQSPLDPRSTYMNSARRAAARVPITRVFTVDRLSDLNKRELKEQIKLDMNAGVNVRLCRWSDLKEKVPYPDFGIWDNEYLCMVSFDKRNRVIGAKLDSRKSAISAANSWRDIILRYSVSVKNDRDIKKFISAYDQK